jgi:hypothetical protein
MTGLYIVIGILVFVVPAVFIIGDDMMWPRKKK